LKCHEPAAFTCALLNSQPMGFYAPAQLVADARRHGVEVLPVDVNASDWDATLEPRETGQPALRLGLRQVKGLSEEGGRRLVEERSRGAYASVQQLATRAGLDRRDLSRLAAAGALRSLSGHRHRVRWAVAGVEAPVPLFEAEERPEALPMLKRPTEGQDIVADYRSLGLSLGRHPLALLRARLDRARYLPAARLRELPSGARVQVAGVVITKQRPGTASGVTFVTLEDETGHVNLILWKAVADRQRDVLLNARLMGAIGELQVESGVIHVVVRRMLDHSHLLGELTVPSRSFR